MLVANVNRRWAVSSLPRSQVRDLCSFFGSFFACLMSAVTTVRVSLPATLANITSHDIFVGGDTLVLATPIAPSKLVPSANLLNALYRPHARGGAIGDGPCRRFDIIGLRRPACCYCQDRPHLSRTHLPKDRHQPAKPARQHPQGGAATV